MSHSHSNNNLVKKPIILKKTHEEQHDSKFFNEHNKYNSGAFQINAFGEEEKRLPKKEQDNHTFSANSAQVINPEHCWKHQIHKDLQENICHKLSEIVGQVERNQKNKAINSLNEVKKFICNPTGFNKIKQQSPHLPIEQEEQEHRALKMKALFEKGKIIAQKIEVEGAKLHDLFKQKLQMYKFGEQIFHERLKHQEPFNEGLIFVCDHLYQIGGFKIKKEDEENYQNLLKEFKNIQLELQQFMPQERQEAEIREINEMSIIKEESISIVRSGINQTYSQNQPSVGRTEYLPERQEIYKLEIVNQKQSDRSYEDRFRDIQKDHYGIDENQ